MGNLAERAIREAKKFTTAGGFNVDIIFQAPGMDAVTVQGLATSHHTNIDTDGEITVGMNAHATIHEAALNDLGVTTRDSSNEINLNQCTLTWTDAVGVTKTYSVIKTIPDNTVGLIPFILGNHGS